MNVTCLLEQSERRCGSHTAWRYGQRSASYAELATRVRAIAGLLRELGLRRGDRVLLCLPNRPELLEVMLGTMWAGLVTVPVNWHLHPDEVAYIAGQSECRAVLLAEETDAVRSALQAPPDGPVVLTADDLPSPGDGPAGSGGAGAGPVQVHAGEPAWLFYTSGTTGRPKGATLTHRNLLAMTLNYYADIDPVPPGSVFAHAAPLTHGSGLYLVPAIGRGATNVILDSTGFDAAAYLALLEREHASHVAFLAPTMLRRLIASDALAGTDLSALRSIVVGGAPLYQADLELATSRVGPIVTQMYGQGESPMTITVMPAAELAAQPGQRDGSCGRPFTGVQVQVRDERGEPVPPGTDGEVCVHGDLVMAGYWNNPAATASAIQQDWLRTGDIGHLDEQGYLYLTDRAKDVIITGGTNVYPREVEEALLTHDEVREVAVIGVPDPEWGESIVAFVVLEPGGGADGDALIGHVRGRLASFKKPRAIHIVDDLPKNAAGKVLKRELRSDPRVS